MIPAAVVDALAGRPTPGVAEYAVALVTVDAEGFPHLILLSRAEVEAEDEQVRAAILGRGTRANLARDGRAVLVVVEGTTVHSLRLEMTESIEAEGHLAARFRVVDHRGDSLGIPVEGFRYTPTEELAQLERWDASASALQQLRGL